jgi:hypothetical protein
MPWICKVKSPYGDKGDKMGHPYQEEKVISPAKYPDLFEFVEEKSDEVILDEFICKHVNACMSATRFGQPYESFDPLRGLARELINAIKPEFLEKLRNGK